MRNYFLRAILGGFLSITLLMPGFVQAQTLTSRVNEAFRVAYGRNPSAAENQYWAGRVARGEKKSFEALLGAMYFQKGLGQSLASATGVTMSKGQPVAVSKDQLIKDVLPLFVEVYKRNPSNAEKVWWRKRISCGEIKNYKNLVSSMGYHLAKKVGKGSDAICGAKPSGASSAGKVGTKSVAGISDHPYGDHIRVGIFNTDGRAIELTANGEYQVREGQKKILGKLGKDDVVKVSWSDGKYHVRGPGVSWDTVNEIRIVPLNSAIVEIRSYKDLSTTISGKNYNRFRGVIEIRKCDGCGELWAINELRVEYYLRGLAETSGTGPEEYIKALGIAARTYALYHKVVTGGRKPAQGFDIGKTADDQLYRGYEYEAITPRMSSIFNQIRGVIATDGEGDTPVSTVYFSDSDGRTRSAKEVWKTDRFPHLQHSVDDPHHAASSCNGHCVGMSAQGAFGFAKADGWSFERILKYYFKGIRLVKAY